MKKPIDRHHLERLSKGEAETANLAEFLSIDFALLMRTLVGGEAIVANEKLGVLAKMQFFSHQLLKFGGIDYLLSLANHSSDTVRGLAVFGLSERHAAASVGAVLDMVCPFAADHHWAVREWAWMAVRPQLVAHLGEAIEQLSSWTQSGDVNIRRFAVEVLRPRGVWCKHIPALRENPALGLALLEPMRAERQKYAQDSVANWLNDASKDRPDFVRNLCGRWHNEAHGDKATARIIRRAMRSIMD